MKCPICGTDTEDKYDCPRCNDAYRYRAISTLDMILAAPSRLEQIQILQSLITGNVPLCGDCAQVWFTMRNTLSSVDCIVCAIVRPLMQH